MTRQAGDWLGILPSSLQFLDSEFHICLQYWLEVPMASDISPCPICSHSADPSGDHALACGGNNDRVLRHNSLRDIVFPAVQSAALSPRRKVPSLVPDSLSCPADVYLPHWARGHPAAVDITVISPLSVAEKRKHAVHFEDCRSVGVSFLSLALETLGGWSQDTQTFL